MRTVVRWCPILVLFAALPTAANAADSAFVQDVQPFLQRHCVGCHGAVKQNSGVRFDQVQEYRNAESPLWTKVHEALRTGSMPPIGRAKPDAAEQNRLLTWIEKHQRSTTAGLRRLNRREMSAALQDLTGLSIDYTLAMPGDGKLGGFDTGADALQDAADSVVQAMTITRRAVDGIRFLEPIASKTLTVNLREAKDPKKAIEEWKTQGVTIKTRGFSLPGKGLLLEPRWVGERDTLNFTLPVQAGVQGVLRLKLVVSAMKPMSGLPNPHLWLEMGAQDIDFREITGTADRPEELVYEVQLDDLAIDVRGLSVHLSNKIEIPYSVEGFVNEDVSKPEDNLPGGTGLFRPQYDRNKTPPDKQPAPFIVLHHVDLEIGYTAAWPPATWKTSLGRIEDSPEMADRLLTLWIDRAWRRPVREAEQQRFRTLYRKLREDGLSFDDALRATFQSVLLSSGFRYLASPVDADAVVAQHAIASRLSFMLWGAPPDAELRRLAAAGKLRDPNVLTAQVDRLLADPRSDAFFRPFVMQWLEMDQPITIASTHLKKQDFRFVRYLKASLRDETLTYIARLFREDRPARELVHSDWTMMNDSTAIHYGYPGIHDGRFRPVTLRDDDPRGGGVLGHAGIQSMLCWMGGNWVIYRGAWAMRHILDDPPPPPPLEVPELNPLDGANKGKSFKQLLRQHQENMNCAVCHRKMDPLGFAFQNFDLSGRWRDNEFESYIMNDLDGRIEWRGSGAARPVDTVGRLPRGEEFKTFAECKQLIVKHYQTDLVRGLMKNLVVYATGRLPDVHDLAEIRTILNDQERNGYPMRELLRAVMRSKAFLER